MNVIRLNSLDEIKNIKRAWEDLLMHSDNRSVFMTWEWLATWWEIFGQDYELWWLGAEKDGKWVGGLPLYSRKLKNGFYLAHRELRFIGTGATVSPEHLDILADPLHSEEVVEVFAGYLKHHAKNWDALLLTDLTCMGDRPVAHAALQLADRLRKDGISSNIQDQKPFAPYIPLPDTWDKYFESLGKWMRRAIARHRNKIAREYGLSFEVWSESVMPLDQALRELMRLYGVRKKQMGVEDKFSFAAGYQKFHRLLAERFAKQGWLHLVFLKVKGAYVACEYTFKYANVIYSYQCGFDPAYGKLNVFKVLRSYLIEYAIKDGMKEFDLLRGEENYKEDWNAVPREKQMIRCFSSNGYGRLLSGIAGLKQMAKRMVTTS